MADTKTADGPDYGANGTIARDLGEQYRQLLETEELTVTEGKRSAPVLVVAKGREIVSIKKYLDEYLKTPERRKGTATALDIKSFIEIVRRFESEDSVVFANPGTGGNRQPSFVAVLDYHPAGAVATEADWLEHRVQFNPRLSEEWKAWEAQNGKFMSQRDFAAFIEERIANVIVPNLDDPKITTYADLVQGKWAEPTDLVALSRGLEINVGMTVKNAVRLSSGEVQLTYTETHNDGSGRPITVPNLFQICVPVFYGGESIIVAAHLRYRHQANEIIWGYQLAQPDAVFQSAFDDMTARVDDELESTVVLGVPDVNTK